MREKCLPMPLGDAPPNKPLKLTAAGSGQSGGLLDTSPGRLTAAAA